MQTWLVTRADAGRTVANLLRTRLRLPPAEARRLLGQGHVYLAGQLCRDAARRVRPGQRLEIRRPTAKPPAAHNRPRTNDQRPRTKYQGPRPVLRHTDAHVIVVEKPAGLTTMRHAHEAAEFGRRAQKFLPPTLADVLAGMLPARPGAPRPTLLAVHRLDKDTSGLVVFARTPAAAKHLGRQFRAHTVGRRYLAVVRGRAHDERIESTFVPDRGDGRRGSAAPPVDGQRAVTQVRVLEEFGEFTLVECRPETGRTHQIRIHLGERGTPICGERIYDRTLNGRPLPDASSAPRLALHAAELAFDHPATGQRMSWTSPLPGDLKGLVDKLQRAKKGPRSER